MAPAIGTPRGAECQKVTGNGGRNTSGPEIGTRKMRRLSKGKSNSPSKSRTSKRSKNEALGRVHSDICGPINPPSAGGNKYMLLFVDDATQMKFACGLKTKTSKEVLDRFKELKEMVELETGKKIKII